MEFEEFKAVAANYLEDAGVSYSRDLDEKLWTLYQAGEPPHAVPTRINSDLRGKDTMTPEHAKEQALRWKELHGLADAEEGSGHFDEAEAVRMQAADIELDLAEAGFSVSQLAAG